MTHSYYNNAENLTGIMLEFGKYILKYKPPQGCTESKVKMEITSEATLPQMLEFFTDFLRASGYVIDENKELVFERKAPDFSQDFWEEDGVSLTGNPNASGDTVISGTGVPGGLAADYWFAGGNDVISFGSPRAAYNFETGAKTWDDVITFG
jgi:hypothetical protein